MTAKVLKFKRKHSPLDEGWIYEIGPAYLLRDPHLACFFDVVLKEKFIQVPEDESDVTE